MRPIPKTLLIHTVTLRQKKSVDRWGKTELDEGTEIRHVRIEPSRQIVRDQNGAEVQLAASLFYDCRNSYPQGIQWHVDDIVDSAGEMYQVKAVESLYDEKTLHHYELGMVRYGKG